MEDARAIHRGVRASLDMVKNSWSNGISHLFALPSFSPQIKMVKSSLPWLALATNPQGQWGTMYTEYGGSPPVYPSPNMTGIGGCNLALSKANDFVADLTLEEKAGMVTGAPGPCVGNIAPIPRLNFRGLCLQDGPLAIRQAVLASVFPAQLSTAASWDRELTRQRGILMAEEFKGKGSHVLLGPVVGPLGRTPYGGRNWEGFAPDPYLSGILVAETVTGIQSVGVQACTKHFIANEQEIQRNPTVVNGTLINAISSNIDDKSLHETYLWPFADAIRAGTASVMCSYNRLNGSYACQNSKAQNGLLKGELGFQGYVMSDWEATHTGVAAIEAGLDMNMPGGIEPTKGKPSFFGKNVTSAVHNGTLSVSRLDDMIRRIMTPYFHLKQECGYPEIDASTVPLNFFPQNRWLHQYALGSTVDVRSNHAQLIRKLGAAGTVLLKNSNKTLPLQKPMNIGVFGNDAADLTTGQYPNEIFDIGTLPSGGGSGAGRYSYVIAPLDAIKSRVQSYGGLVQYITSNKAIVSGGLSSLAPQPLDACILFLKSWAREADDRYSLLADWDSTAVVESTTAVCNNTIIVLHGAGPNVLPWKDNANVTAILAAHMPGQETGNAIVDLLWGDENPSGKLPYTIGKKESDYAIRLVNSTALQSSTDPNAWQDDFKEGNLIDYKGFAARSNNSNTTGVAYEFGFGLSYTTFALSDVLQIALHAQNISRLPSASAPILPGGNTDLWTILATVAVDVKNTGDLPGATVPQLYLALPAEAGAGTAGVNSLRGFEKVMLQPGETATVKFQLRRRDLSYWDVHAQQWRVPRGKVAVKVGFSSLDLRVGGNIVL